MLADRSLLQKTSSYWLFIRNRAGHDVVSFLHGGRPDNRVMILDLQFLTDLVTTDPRI